MRNGLKQENHTSEPTKTDCQEKNDVQYHLNRDSEEDNYDIKIFRNSSSFKEAYSKSNMLSLKKNMYLLS